MDVERSEPEGADSVARAALKAVRISKIRFEPHRRADRIV